MSTKAWHTLNPGGSNRVIVTKTLPGKRWVEVLTAAGCRI